MSYTISCDRKQQYSGGYFSLLVLSMLGVYVRVRNRVSGVLIQSLFKLGIHCNKTRIGEYLTH
jgi:hypothetical protein